MMDTFVSATLRKAVGGGDFCDLLNMALVAPADTQCCLSDSGPEAPQWCLTGRKRATGPPSGRKQLDPHGATASPL